jgi:hypothetical protein
MAGPTFDDLVANRTLTPEIAAALIEAARAKRSFLVFAQPRLAGKTTLQELMLAHTPPGTPTRTVGVDGDDVEALARDARGGYLVIPEIAREAARPGYIWGEPVRAAFAARGCSLAVVLHADSADEAIGIIRENAVPDADLERLELLIHLRSLGKWEEPTRRVVAHIHEGVAARRLLHRWDEASDRFEVGPPRH